MFTEEWMNMVKTSTKELENIKKKDQLGLKNTINKMKNTLEGINIIIYNGILFLNF